ncbi:MAG: flavin reductase family protein [Deinococcales bacterium]|nr:flavin reductase family protein [Chitinophagaceae bacterium]
MLINLADISIMERQHWLQHAVAPRPIALASTIDAAGNVNLSPFSFFNLFSFEPPIVIFSPSRRVRDNTTKHTLQNVLEVPEVVINICDSNMVQQLSLASCEFPKGINEYEKAGFTMQASHTITPPMVKEAKIKLECIVDEVKPLGTNGGAGNLVICKVMLLHVDDGILNETNTMIDQQKMHHVARLGGDWYTAVSATNLFKINKPSIQIAIGIDGLPDSIRSSKVLTGNDLAMLANVTAIPIKNASFIDHRLELFQQQHNNQESQANIHYYVKELLLENKLEQAWQILLNT